MDEEKRTVKRTFGILAGLAVLGAAVYLGRIWAQPPQPAQPPAHVQTRSGLVNMVQILKNYKKFQRIEEEIRAKSLALENWLKPLRDKAIALKGEYGSEKVTAQRKEEIEHEMRKLQLEMQEKEDQAKKELVKINGDAAVQIYHEVEDAVKLYARSNSLDLVMFYNDAVTEPDFYHPANVQRKLTQPAAVMPMYVAPGMDISDSVCSMLNQRYAGSASNQPAPGQPGAPTPAPAPAPGAPGAPGAPH